MASNNFIVISFSIAILLLLSLLLIVSYNSKCKIDNVEKFYDNSQLDRQFMNGGGALNNQSQSIADVANKTADVNMASSGIGNISASDPYGNEMYNDVVNSGDNFNPSMDLPNSSQASCFPRDKLTAEDLLPKDAANSRWAQLNPSGTGNINDQNFLTAGYQIGINTVGQSLRNANLQIRSEPPNPQVAVSPWLISTIEPDLRQNVLEIGSAPSY